MTEMFQLSLEQAKAYEELFVPALFGQWAPQLVDCARVRTGQRVLDVACGTGVVARCASEVVGERGRVVGVDLNPAMLEVAGSVQPGIDWRLGDAEELPFAEGEFDVALCQSALFFFKDPSGAVREMARVVRNGGTVAVQTYASLDPQPGYGPFVDVVAAHAGPEARLLLGTYWSQGDVQGLTAMLSRAGLTVVESRSSLGVAIFPSAAAVVHTEIRATPLVDRISDATYQQILTEAGAVLGRYADADGTVRLPIQALLVAARKD